MMWWYRGSTTSLRESGDTGSVKVRMCLDSSKISQKSDRVWSCHHRITQSLYKSYVKVRGLIGKQWPPKNWNGGVRLEWNESENSKPTKLAELLWWAEATSLLASVELTLPCFKSWWWPPLNFKSAGSEKQDMALAGAFYTHSLDLSI